MASRTVYRCTQDMVCWVKDQRTHFNEGDLVFEDHPVKPKGSPHFEEISEYVERSSKPYRRGVPVEDTSAEPGQKRTLSSLLGFGAKAPATDADDAPERPPVSGAGSSVEAWREYAAKVTDSTVESWSNLNRSEIIELLDSEGADDGQE